MSSLNINQELSGTVTLPYPNIQENAEKLPPKKKATLLKLFKRVSDEASQLPKDSRVLSDEQAVVKYLHGRFEMIDTIFKGAHGGPLPSEDEKMAWMIDMSSEACHPALVSMNESFIANLGNPEPKQVVPHLIREMKRNAIQEIITSNLVISENRFHTINAMNLLIKDRRDELGIDEADSLYKEALTDEYIDKYREGICRSGLFDSIGRKRIHRKGYCAAV